MREGAALPSGPLWFAVALGVSSCKREVGHATGLLAARPRDHLLPQPLKEEGHRGVNSQTLGKRSQDLSSACRNFCRGASLVVVDQNGERTNLDNRFAESEE